MLLPLLRPAVQLFLIAAVQFRKHVPDISPVVDVVLSTPAPLPDQKQREWRVVVESWSTGVRIKADSGAAAIANPFHSPELAEYMRKTYFSRFPLWSQLALGIRQQMSNATAEAGVKVLKHDEADLLRLHSQRLRVDEFVAVRVPVREAQCRLLLTQVKQNLRSRKRKQQSDLDATEDWQRKRFPLSVEQRALLSRLQTVVQWRRDKTKTCTLTAFCEEIKELAGQTRAVIGTSSLSKMLSAKYWPSKQSTIDRIVAWVDREEPLAAASAGASCFAVACTQFSVL